MRLLLLGLATPDSLCRHLAAHAEVTGFFARYVNLGDFGTGRAPTDFDLPYRLRSGRVFPIQPYPYSRWLPASALRAVIRHAEPEVALYVGEPSELAAAQALLIVRKLIPQARLGVCVFENIRRDWRGKLKWLRGRAERAVLQHLDFAACASLGAVQALADLGLPQDRSRVIYPQVDSELFRPTDAASLRDDLGMTDDTVVGFCGRIVWEKGLDILLKAIAGLPSQYKLLLLGSGRYLDALRDQIRALGISERVIHLPAVPGDQVPAHLCAMDMLVLPSRSIPTWQEQYGRVLPEAMLCGVPVIGSDSGAIPEVIADTGLIFPEQDVEGLREAILRYGEDMSFREGMAAAARQRAHGTFAHTYATDMPQWLDQAARLPLRNPSA